MGEDRIKVVAATQKGAALLVLSGSWRVLIITSWEGEIFSQLLRGGDSQIHAVFLPGYSQAVPEAFDLWLERVHPLLVALPEVQSGLVPHLASRNIPYLELRDVGAISFRQKGRRLELFSFLKGPLGFYSYI